MGKTKYIKKKLNKMPILSEFLGALIRIRKIIINKKRFKNDMTTYKRMNTNKSFEINSRQLYPKLMDVDEAAGTLSSYYWQDLWAARLIAKNKPKTHYDIGSRIDGFIAHLQSFRDDIVLIDIRPLDVDIPGVSFIQADATCLDEIKDNSLESISALCSIEHFGLGRYGDPIDPDACFKAFRAISQKLAYEGHAYISVPIGYEHLEYNAHRVYFAKTIINCFNSLELLEFSTAYYEEYIENDRINRYDNEKDNQGERFGLFHFIKRYKDKATDDIVEEVQAS